MIFDALKKGWGVSEIEMALMDLVIAQIRATEANIDVDQAVRQAAQRVVNRSAKQPTYRMTRCVA